MTAGSIGKALTCMLFALQVGQLSGQSIELMAGHHGLFADVQFFRPVFKEIPALTVFSRTRGTLDREGQADLLSVLYLNYTTRIGIGLSATSSLGGNGGNLGTGIHFFRANERITFFGLAAVELANGPVWSWFSILRWHPQLSEHWRMYISVELYASLAQGAHRASVQRLRIGPDRHGVQFGLAANLAEIGSEGAFSSNAGIFLRREF